MEDGREEEEKAKNHAVLEHVRPLQMSVGHQIQTPKFIHPKEKKSRGWGLE